MKNKKSPHHQINFLMPDLSSMLNERRPLYRLAHKIPWEEFEEAFEEYYDDHDGAPAKPIRLMVSLLILKQLYDLSDEAVTEQWVENPYFQYFSGEEHFQWKLPIDPTSLVKFRQRIGEKGTEKILAVSIKLHGAKVKEKEVVADTTVQEKNMTYPTDSKLHKKIVQKCQKIAEEEGIKLRRSYRRTVPKLMKAQHHRRHPKRAKAARAAARRLKGIAGRLTRELKRKLAEPSLKKHQETIHLFTRVLNQRREDSKKVYSLHEPEVCCISKGKEAKKYEFGQKAIVLSSKESGIIIGAQSCPGNPYDGHTLAGALEQSERLTGARAKVCLVDKGFRGPKEIKGTAVLMPSKPSNQASAYEKQKARKRFRKRAGIEAVIGHLKSDYRLKRNFLKGLKGDAMNMHLAAAAFNLKKWLNQGLTFALWMLGYCHHLQSVWLDPLALQLKGQGNR